MARPCILLGRCVACSASGSVTRKWFATPEEEEKRQVLQGVWRIDHEQRREAEFRLQEHIVPGLRKRALILQGLRI
jgi:hypothetical protein